MAVANHSVTFFQDFILWKCQSLCVIFYTIIVLILLKGANNCDVDIIKCLEVTWEKDEETLQKP